MYGVFPFFLNSSPSRVFGSNQCQTQQQMLGSFVRRGLTQQEAESESLLQMYVSLLAQALKTPHLISSHSIAGSDTTATAIRTTMLYVITNPARLRHYPQRNRYLP